MLKDWHSSNYPMKTTARFIPALVCFLTQVLLNTAIAISALNLHLHLCLHLCECLLHVTSFSSKVWFLFTSSLFTFLLFPLNRSEWDFSEWKSWVVTHSRSGDGHWVLSSVSSLALERDDFSPPATHSIDQLDSITKIVILYLKGPNLIFKFFTFISFFFR